MNKITGVIKGDEHDAVTAARDHGLEVKVTRYIPETNETCVQFMYTVPMSVLVRWFDEHTRTGDEQFPDGTLLILSCH